jgi:Acetyltransferase (GNAT) family
MMFSDKSLAINLELNDVEEHREHVETAARIFPGTPSEVQRIGSGHTFFAGRGSHRYNRAIGFGMQSAVEAREIDQLEAFYRRVGLPTSIVVCPYADRTLLSTLAVRPYRIERFYNVLCKALGSDDTSTASPPEIEIRSEESTDLSIGMISSGFGLESPDHKNVLESYWTSFNRPSVTLFTAWIGERMVGGGAVCVRNGLATLFGSRTHPAYRKRGIHRSLLRARLAFAVAGQCRSATLIAVPGGNSQRNHEWSGFQVVFTKLVMTEVKKWPKSSA